MKNEHPLDKEPERAEGYLVHANTLLKSSLIPPYVFYIFKEKN